MRPARGDGPSFASDPPQGSCTIGASPSSAARDTPVDLTVRGLETRERVTLRARAVDEGARTWYSWASFTADGKGILDLGRAQPLDGTYKSADRMGLFWSMRPDSDEGAEPQPFLWRTLDPVNVNVTVEVRGRVRAATRIERLAVSPQTTVVRGAGSEAGLVATLFHPTTPGPHPAVVVLSGSSGGLREDVAALLAAHGFVTLALAYFGVRPLPTELANVPLEYFGRALLWLRGSPLVDPQRVALLGSSKGGELALLLASTYREHVRAVVGLVPSGIAWQGIDSGPRAPRGPRSSWTLNGEPVPFLRFVPLVGGTVRRAAEPPFAVREIYERSLDHAAAPSAAFIPVERIGGPVLLVSGTDDLVWPSTRLCEMVMERLEDHRHPFAREHLRYDGAGHAIAPPYLPPAHRLGPLALGGHAEATARAGRDSWRRIVAFLRVHLHAPRG